MNIMLTTDNYSAIILYEKLLEKEWNEFEFQHYRCAAHILNIAINYGMQLQTTLIEKVRNFVTKIHYSTIFCDEL